MAILRGGGAGGRELQAPDGLDLAGPARDERRCVVVAVRAEIRTAVRRGDRLEARTSRPHHRSPLTRPSRGVAAACFSDSPDYPTYVLTRCSVSPDYPAYRPSRGVASAAPRGGRPGRTRR